MSWTSPFTVASTTLPRVAESTRSMWGSRWATANFIDSADCSTSATMSWLALNWRPTSSIPAISGPLIISNGVRPAMASSRSSANPSLEPSMMAMASRSSRGRLRRSSVVDLGARSLKWAAKAATGSSPRFQIRSSASLRSSSGMDVYLCINSELTMAMSSPAWTQWYRNTELSTSRPEGGSPKETLEMPRTVLQRGRACLMSRTPSMVSSPDPT